MFIYSMSSVYIGFPCRRRHRNLRRTNSIWSQSDLSPNAANAPRDQLRREETCRSLQFAAMMCATKQAHTYRNFFTYQMHSEVNALKLSVSCMNSRILHGRASPGHAGHTKILQPESITAEECWALIMHIAIFHRKWMTAKAASWPRKKEK